MENRRAIRKVRILMSRYEETFIWRLVKDIRFKSTKDARAKFQSAKDTAQKI